MLEKFEQFNDHVVAHLVKTVADTTVPETTKASWLVGTDGARSGSFLGETPEGEQIVVGDINVKGLDSAFWHIWGDPKDKVVSIRPSGQDPKIFNFVILGKNANHDALNSSHEKLISFLYKMTGSKDLITFGDVIWNSVYCASVRMVDKFHVGRVFIAGDAAHCHSPTGGQGMNSSVQDAFNLGWKLAFVIRGLAPITLIDTDAPEDNPKDQNDREAAMHHVVELHTLGVNYRSSSIVFDDDTLERAIRAAYGVDSAFASKAGDRAPDAPGLVQVTAPEGKTSLFELFKANYHTVLTFGGAEQHEGLLSTVKKLPKGLVKTVLVLGAKDEKPATAEGFDVVVTDSEGYAHAGYHVGDEEVKFVIVRPYGIIGARVGTVANVEKYFSKIFN
ncbi:FAD binding domain-containing protein [Cyathus striatus]|nr:FAD binding domain-containing protein [Cyathus striatus]